MGIFDRLNNATRGMMDMIRCDQPDYLVWHWQPQNGAQPGRENAIRFGSSLRVKAGEAAVFVYRQSSGVSQEVIYGPYDGIIETKNFPVLADLLAHAYSGGTPFQADVYFINMAGVVQMRFGIPYTDTADPRFPDFIVPVCAGGIMSFRISDINTFIAKHRLIGFSIDDLREQVRQVVERVAKTVISNAPYTYQVPVTQIERVLDSMSAEIERKISPEMSDFGIEMTRWDLNRVEPDKSSSGWEALINITRGRQEQVLNTQTEMEVKNLRDMQAINAENMAESLRVQREELQRAQRLQTETSYISAHALNRQADVLQAAAENLGQMSSLGGGGGDGSGGGGMNPAGMMAGMYMGGAVGGQFMQMMQQMNPAMSGAYGAVTPPPVPGQQPAVEFHILNNGQPAGPFNFGQLQQLAAAGTFTPATYVWRPGMAAWEQASNVPEAAAVFNAGANAVPPVPPVPPTTPSTPTP